MTSFYLSRKLEAAIRTSLQHIAIECKATVAPKLSSGNHTALKDIRPQACFIAAPVSKGYPMTEGVDVASLPELIQQVAACADLWCL